VIALSGLMSNIMSYHIPAVDVLNSRRAPAFRRMSAMIRKAITYFNPSNKYTRPVSFKSIMTPDIPDPFVI